MVNSRQSFSFASLRLFQFLNCETKLLYLQCFLTVFSVEFLVELDVPLTGLFSICAWFLFPVLLCRGEFCCVLSVVLRCVVL